MSDAVSLPRRLVAAGMAAALGAAASAAPDPISMKSLLREMTDLAGLAEFPAPAYTCRQFSSYDRASKGLAENWFANGDCGQYLRVEERDGRKEFVMMDAKGPGAIVRIWSANPNGTLRIYLDGAEKPALEAPMSELLGGRVAGLPRPIAGEYSKGWNLYLPIPYAKHCKVTSDRGEFYYHVNYRTWPPGTAVTTFDAAQLAAAAAELAALARGLDAPAGLNPPPQGSATKSFAAAIEPGAAAVLGEFEGPRAIHRLRVRYTPTGDRDEPALRGLVLQAVFDGETTVEAPLGDFFGTGPGLNAYESLPLSVTEEGRLESRWVMPFRRSARVSIRNLGAEPVRVEGAIDTAPRPWTDGSLLFHARWRAQHGVPTDPKIDWNYLTARGRGVFAGVAFAIDNPVKDWWGEGDEKIYVDGEAFPSHFGTGTEDYYGYAWCFPALFTHAYHNQPRCDGPGNYGRTSVNRFHILDRIPFQRDFRFDMELWHWKKCEVNMGIIAYWYAAPGATDGFRALEPDDVAVLPLPEYQPAKVKGAIEGEGMKILAKTGAPEVQGWGGTSGEEHLWWKGGQKPGDTLVLGFEAPRDGRYRVMARFLKAQDYGIARFAVNDQPAGEPIDFYNPEVIVTGEIDLGTFALKAGENRFSETIVGANEKAIKSYMVGLDYLRLVPVE